MSKGGQMRFSLLLALALLWNMPAEAQTKPRVQIVIEPLEQGSAPQSAARCGITKSSLESTAALTLGNNGILTSTEVPKANSPFLYVSVMTLQPTERTCLFATEVALQGFTASNVARQAIGGFKPKRRSHTVLCQEHRVDFATVALSGPMVLKNLDGMIKLCLGNVEF